MKKIFSSLICLILASSSSFASQKELKQELIEAKNFAKSKGDSKIFSGEVQISEMFKANAWQGFSAGLVEFSPRARSAWHTHPAGQTLIVTKGVIVTGTEQGIVQVAYEGDVILCPPNLKHWHGAGENEGGSHLALTHSKDGKNVFWLEKVSDEEYQEALKKIK
ncbi:cupin domain-containing protein [Helicobacter marmotae]|uniref:Cupin domain-containing protein n=1 Tax=Helicobacter marmotae TaxID=152490 RepID=A0A3D8I1L5_9HELI|nr:cupin domain-containing protein [Helicobacter marmotae]RDU58985.1 cupin domain-containing protein [Helicobacter marmotae]